MENRERVSVLVIPAIRNRGDWKSGGRRKNPGARHGANREWLFHWLFTSLLVPSIMNEAKRNEDSTALFRDRPFHLAYIPPVFSK